MLVTPAPAAGLSPARERCLRALERQEKRRPKYLATALPSSLTSLLGVLREAPAQKVALPAEAIREIGLYQYTSVWLSDARLLATGADDLSFYLVPGIFAPQPEPEVCTKLLPQRERKDAKLVYQKEPHGPVAVLEGYSPDQSGGFPYTPSMITSGKAHQFANESLYGLVPDGVASITATLDSEAPITAQVANNFFLMPMAQLKAGKLTLIQQWYAASGALINTVTETFETRSLTVTF